MKIQKHGPIDPIKWLSSYNLYPKFFWRAKGSECEVATIGSALETSLDQIEDHKSAVNVVLSFDLDPSKSRIWIPDFELHRFSNEALIISNKEPYPEKNPLNKLKENKLQSFSCMPDFKMWDRSIAKAKKMVEKVVIARKQTIFMEDEVNALGVFSKLKEKSENSFLFFYQPNPHEAFLGSSPETLFIKKDQKIISESIAGTRKRGKSISQDISLKNELLTSKKELKEFEYVKNHIKSIYEKICFDYEISKINICKTNWVQHLYTKFTGILKNGYNCKELINLFHPTPAVGGFPKNQALDFIQKTEPFNRSFYAAPIGRASHFFSEFAVGIRSCLVKKKQIDVFAGTGIIDSSNSRDEWKELENKSNWIFEVI